LAGVWSAHKANLTDSGVGKAMGKLTINVADGGAPPSLPVHFVIGKWDFGSFDLSPPAYVWTFVRVCILISAVFLCRALIFGG